MPRFLLPKRTTAHRVASIALYRALLSQSSAAPISGEQRTTLQNAIRNRFRDNRELQSHQLLQVAFRAGYEGLDLLDGSVAGDTESTEFLSSFIADIPSRLTRSQTRPVPKPQPPPSNLVCLPPEKNALTLRPRPTVPGRRHIPNIASANGLPFLRFTKPQPANLSRVLRQTLDARDKTFQQVVMLKNYWMPLAKYEEEWDDIVRRELRLGPSSSGVTWTSAVEDAMKDNALLVRQRRAKDIEMARKMQDIVDQETELARLEDEKRDAEKKKRIAERKEMNKACDVLNK
ncbi:hypothetical protein K432DRAFT_445032 [Lepidopterella palustris CBS 459.81]|uniref:Complex 1 LYR protein domain-containing protein n=1 Tax=Lepidopterella palustris CBS 459.81 TaxID=1314670 RepID=A0A8E2E5Q0_9PEZI|nr:hypothetical protein K432DRAFT_445032 [Lepidopterella palustris CBS 459.81]